MPLSSDAHPRQSNIHESAYACTFYLFLDPSRIRIGISRRVIISNWVSVFLHYARGNFGQTALCERVTLLPTLLAFTGGVSLPRAVLVKRPGGVI
jgi:hypothetical protein